MTINKILNKRFTWSETQICVGCSRALRIQVCLWTSVTSRTSKVLEPHRASYKENKTRMMFGFGNWYTCDNTVLNPQLSLRSKICQSNPFHKFLFILPLRTKQTLYAINKCICLFYRESSGRNIQGYFRDEETRLTLSEEWFAIDFAGFFRPAFSSSRHIPYV